MYQKVFPDRLKEIEAYLSQNLHQSKDRNVKETNDGIAGKCDFGEDSSKIMNYFEDSKRDKHN